MGPSSPYLWFLVLKKALKSCNREYLDPLGKGFVGVWGGFVYSLGTSGFCGFGLPAILLGVQTGVVGLFDPPKKGKGQTPKPEAQLTSDSQCIVPGSLARLCILWYRLL